MLDEDFGPAGATLVESITATFDFSEEPGKLAILARTARTADTIAALKAEATTQPMTAKGSMGQEVISPLIAEAQAQTSLLDKLLKSLGLPESDQETAAKAEQRQRRARKAAQTRWGTDDYPQSFQAWRYSRGGCCKDSGGDLSRRGTLL